MNALAEVFFVRQGKELEVVAGGCVERHLTTTAGKRADRKPRLAIGGAKPGRREIKGVFVVEAVRKQRA